MAFIGNFSGGEVVNTSSCPDVEEALFWTLHCYPVSLTEILLNISLFIIGLVTMALNIVAVHAVFQRGEIESVSDIAITSLAITDALIGVLLSYQSVYNWVNWQIFYECLFRYGIIFGADLTSAFHLCFLTFERYIKISRPYIYPNLFKKRTVLTVSAIIWSSTFLVCLSPMMGWNKQTEKQCGFYYVLQREYELVMVISFMVPLILNYIFYGLIFQIAHKHAKRIANQNTVSISSDPTSNQTWKFTKTVFILMGFYSICWLPSAVFLLLDYVHFLDYISLQDKGIIITYLSLPTFLYSLGNPIIYAIKIPYIRQHYRSVLGKIPCCCCIKGP